MKKFKIQMISIISMLVIFLAIILVSAVGSASKQESERKPIPGPRETTNPRAADPVGSRSNYTIFREDELFALYYYDTDQRIHYELYDNKLDDTIDSGITNPIKYDFPAPVVASGRITTPEKDQVVYAFNKSDSEVQVILRMDDGTHKEITLAGGATSGETRIGLAVGDLDGKSEEGDDNDFHDEIIVTYQGADGKHRYTILDHNLDKLGEETDIYTAFNPVTIGDFDGDGIMEYAVFRDRHLLIFQDLSDENNKNRKGYTQIKQVIDDKIIPHPFSAKLTSGDFNGDGDDEVALCYSHTDGQKMRVEVLILDIDSNLEISKKGIARSTIDRADMNDESKMWPTITSGVFKFDINNGYGLNRRQVAVYFPNMYYFSPMATKGKHLRIRIYDVSDDLKTVAELDTWNVYSKQVQDVTPPEVDPTIGSDWQRGSEIAVGNFLGKKGDTDNPTFDIAISYIAAGWKPEIRVFNVSNGGKLAQKKKISGFHYINWTIGIVPPIVAADTDGNSLYLGPPAHIVVNNLVRTFDIINAPPQHIDYLPKDPNNPDGEWEVKNISRMSDFYVNYETQSGQSMSTSRKTTASTNTSKSSSLSTKESISAKFCGVSAGINSSQTENIKSSQSSTISQSNTTSETKTSATSSRAMKDDQVKFLNKTIHIWRYPCFGSDWNDDNNPGFYEIIVPGIPRLDLSFNPVGGFNLADWYQPVHENGNIFSYPKFGYQVQGEEYVPEDIGPFEAGGQNKTKIMASYAAMVDANPGSNDISWSEEAGSSSSKSYKSTLKKSNDVKVGTNVSVKLGFFKVTGSVKSDYNSSSSSSWSSNTVVNVKTSESNGIKINYPMSVDPSGTYALETVIYISQDGTLKVSHAVDPAASTQSTFFDDYYRRKPDPALNLPMRFKWTGSDWEIDKTSRRNRMRGLFLRKKEPNPETDEKGYYASAIPVGDTVEVVARVYNYCLKKHTGSFNVKFEYVTYDDETNTQGTQRNLIGTVNVDNIAPFENDKEDKNWKEVSVDWNTTGIGGDAPGDSKHYVVYVTVDPDNQVDEIHELYENVNDSNNFIKSNNVGYWPWKGGISIYTPLSDSWEPAPKSNIYVHEESLAIQVGPDEFVTGEYQAEKGKMYELRAHIKSDVYNPGYRHVIFYDNGQPFASKILQGVDADSYAWAEWTAEDDGVHELKIQVLEDYDDTNPGNHEDTLTVTVGQVGSESGSCFIATAAYGSF